MRTASAARATSRFSFFASLFESRALEPAALFSSLQTFTDAVSRQFGALGSVRLAEGRDLGASYLIGKAADGYVVLVSQPYSDG